MLWLWQVLREINQAERSRLLAFITGTDRVPLDGYDPPFNVTFGTDMVKDSLPKAHTCFNHILIPKYKTKEKLGRLLRIAIENAQGFGMM